MVIENPVLISNLESIRGSLSNNLFKKLMKYPLKKSLRLRKIWLIKGRNYVKHYCAFL